jgi:hypothetical protein
MDVEIAYVGHPAARKTKFHSSPLVRTLLELDAHDATLFVLLQPDPFRTRLIPSPVAVLSVTLEGQITPIPTAKAFVAVLPTTVLPSPA